MATDLSPSTETAPVRSSNRFDDWADRVLSGGELTRDEARQILESDDDEILRLVDAASRIRKKHFGKTVQLYFLMNAKSGLCPEDCHYCSQSKISDAEIPKYNILKRDKLMDAARIAAEQGAKTYCLVISARGPNEREMKAVEEIVPVIKEQYGLDICACLGLLSREQADRLKACGVDRVNHNLNTGEEYYGKICTTHTYADRVETLRHVKNAGMEMCSGGIIGMGETIDDVISMAFDLKDLGVQSIPLNFLNAIDGTPLQGNDDLSPQDCLRALAMFRFVNPDRELRIAGGRELHLRSLQSLGLYIANSVFVGDYLTTKGQAPEEDYQLIRDLGFDVTTKVGE
ncbi:biotin synthase BioB [Roseiconus lacunae]|uniref:Biotin synthase n=1 Tax=Roseiconus lacunae TaxID=2605694 RepID=A0ABT7PC41_9BACT|nr:biotin synthase BioB [Roseiconus lacunae]MCD0463498.1 biotin synthase BioB [Roseiconus lacunae]MDM4014052.1 biotin synthase BioB [Roseiconus lacunae]WRQ53345.1 biotin synthase BioB [Stieleria sp. HD01]